MECTCDVCGKVLDGLEYTYGNQITCSKCTKKKSSVLHCERGCKVRAIYLDAGYTGDQETARKCLKQDGEYTVKCVRVGRSSSEIELQEVPRVVFNTVHFTRIDRGEEKNKPEYISIPHPIFKEEDFNTPTNKLLEWIYSNINKCDEELIVFDADALRNNVYKAETKRTAHVEGRREALTEVILQMVKLKIIQ